MIAAAHVHTIKTYGPDRVAGFSPIPAMSMVSHAAGARFMALIGAPMLSFYDWYADLPVASPQVFGDQTDVPESGDWWDASYLILWGSNVPVTRTPDAHWMTEARYRGQKVVVMSPDYSDATKFADEWLAPHPGTDGALAMAMGHVVLKEFFVDRQVPRFTDYVKRYSDLPFLLTLDSARRRLRAGQVPHRGRSRGRRARARSSRPSSSTRRPGEPAVPERVAGLPVRRGGQGPVEPRPRRRRPAADPARGDAERCPWTCPVRHRRRRGRGDAPRRAGAAGRQAPGHDGLRPAAGPVRRRPRRPAGGVADRATTTPSQPYTPAWQEQFTGVAGGRAARIGREFAQNAEDSGGRSMIIMGAGTNHWFHSDTIYRAFLALTTLTGCQGVNGGGWAHYVGQEKVRPITGYATLAAALDWARPPRQMIQTAYWYLHTDQWRYDHDHAGRLRLAAGRGAVRRQDTGRRDRPVGADGLDAVVPDVQPQPAGPGRRGGRRRQGTGPARRRRAAGRPAAVRRRGSGRAGELPARPDHVAGQPARLLREGQRVLPASTCSAPSRSVRADEAPPEAAPARRRLAGGGTRPGKLDLLVTLDFRMTSTHGVLRHRAAGGHLVREVRPVHAPTCTRSCTRSTRRSRRRGRPAPTSTPSPRSRRRSAGSPRRTSACARDLVAVPLLHDTPDELANPRGVVRGLEGRRVRAGPGQDDAEARRGGAGLRGRRGEDGRARPAGGASSALTTKGVTFEPARGGRVPRGTRTASCAAASRDGRPSLARDVHCVRGDPGAVGDDERAAGHAGLPRARGADRHAAGRPGRRARGQADHLRRHPGPARRR